MLKATRSSDWANLPRREEEDKAWGMIPGDRLNCGLSIEQTSSHSGNNEKAFH